MTNKNKHVSHFLWILCFSTKHKNEIAENDANPLFLVAPCYYKERLHLSLCEVVRWSVCPWHDPHPTPGNMTSDFFFTQNFSPPKEIFLAFTFFMHFWMFRAILSAQIFFTQKFCSMSCGWSKGRHNAAKHSSFCGLTKMNEIELSAHGVLVDGLRGLTLLTDPANSPKRGRPKT